MTHLRHLSAEAFRLRQVFGEASSKREGRVCLAIARGAKADEGDEIARYSRAYQTAFLLTTYVW